MVVVVEVEPEAAKWNGSVKQRCGHLLGIGECNIGIDHGSESERVCLRVSVSVSLRVRSEVGIFSPDRVYGEAVVVLDFQNYRENKFLLLLF